MPNKPDDLAAVIAEQVAAALAKRDSDARKSKDPETMADLIDRIADATVDKLYARADTDGADEDDDDGGEERAPVAEHPFFKPLFGKAG